MSEAFVQMGLNQCFFGRGKFPHFFNLQTIILTHTKDFVEKKWPTNVKKNSKSPYFYNMFPTCNQNIKGFSYLVYCQIWLNLLVDDR
jgi:hypothetical protein